MLNDLPPMPPLYGQEDKGRDAIVYAKLFLPGTGATWYATEHDPEQGLCWGLTVLLEVELGYFSLTELENIRSWMGLPVERDLYWKPCPLKDLPECPQWLRDGESPTTLETNLTPLPSTL